MCDPDFTNHETDKFTEENDRDGGVDSITQPLEPNDFVLQKWATKKTVKCFVGLVQEMRPVITPDFWITDSHVGYFVSQRLQALQK